MLLLAIAAQLPAACRQTIALEDRNPGNISPQRLSLWNGATGYDDAGHAIFATKREGLEALRDNLQAYWRRHHLNTVRKIVRRWTSRKDDPHEIADYINGVAYIVAAAPDEKLDMENPDVLEALAHGIALEESGCGDAYPESLWDSVFHNIHP